MDGVTSAYLKLLIARNERSWLRAYYNLSNWKTLGGSQHVGTAIPTDVLVESNSSVVRGMAVAMII